jgi:hypothetical protein
MQSQQLHANLRYLQTTSISEFESDFFYKTCQKSPWIHSVVTKVGR